MTENGLLSKTCSQWSMFNWKEETRKDLEMERIKIGARENDETFIRKWIAEWCKMIEEWWEDFKKKEVELGRQHVRFKNCGRYFRGGNTWSLTTATK